DVDAGLLEQAAVGLEDTANLFQGCALLGQEEALPHVAVIVGGHVRERRAQTTYAVLSVEVEGLADQALDRLTLGCGNGEDVIEDTGALAHDWGGAGLYRYAVSGNPLHGIEDVVHRRERGLHLTDTKHASEQASLGCIA